MPLRLATSQSFDLELSCNREEGVAICRSALEGLGWEITAAAGRIEAAEPAERLCCVTWPVNLTLSLAGSEGGGCDVRVEGTTPGRGPLQKRQLRDRLGRLRTELLERARKS